MEYAYSILMLVFAFAIFVYAGILGSTGNYELLPVRGRVSAKKPKDPKAYARQLAKVISLVACAPLLSALAGLWNIPAAAAVLILAAVLFLFIGTRMMRKVL